MFSLNRIVSKCFAAALRRYHRKFPGASRVTAEKFARETFAATCEALFDRAHALLDSGVSPARLLREAVRDAYSRLVAEHIKFAAYAA